MTCPMEKRRLMFLFILLLNAFYSSFSLNCRLSAGKSSSSAKLLSSYKNCIYHRQLKTTKIEHKSSEGCLNTFQCNMTFFGNRKHFRRNVFNIFSLFDSSDNFQCFPHLTETYFTNYRFLRCFKE